MYLQNLFLLSIKKVVACKIPMDFVTFMYKKENSEYRYNTLRS